MPTRPIACPERVDCTTATAADLPVRNTSSEAPDIPSEPIPFGGVETPYIPPDLSPEDGGGTGSSPGIPTCPSGGFYDPAFGNCSPNNPAEPDCSEGLVIVKAVSEELGDVRDYLNSIREKATLCPEGCFWIVRVPNALGETEVIFSVDGFLEKIIAVPGTTDDGNDFTLIDRTPPDCACGTRYYVKKATWGNTTQGFMDVTETVQALMVVTYGCCEENPDVCGCAYFLTFKITREVLGDNAPGLPHVNNTFTVDIFELSQFTQYVAPEGGTFFSNKPENCNTIPPTPPPPPPPPDPPPDPPDPPPVPPCEDSETLFHRDYSYLLYSGGGCSASVQGGNQINWVDNLKGTGVGYDYTISTPEYVAADVAGIIAFLTSSCGTTWSVTPTDGECPDQNQWKLITRLT